MSWGIAGGSSWDSMGSSFDGGCFQHEFEQRMARAQEQVRKILAVERHPQHPANVPHRYEDKYILAELATKAAVAGHISALAFAIPGFQQHLPRYVEWAKTRTVTLAFSSDERCALDRTEVRKVDSATEHVTESTLRGRRTSKVQTTITEHFWSLSVEWTLAAYAGSDPHGGQRVVLLRGSGKHELKTTGLGVAADNPPRNPKTEHHSIGPFEVNLGWLLAHADGEFRVDREQQTCATPRRNADVDAAAGFFQRFEQWCGNVRQYLLQQLFAAQTGHGADLGVVTADGVFAPVLAMFALEARPAAAPAPGGGPVVTAGAGGDAPPLTLSLPDFESFLEEQRRSLSTRGAALAAALPSDAAGQLISTAAAVLAVGLEHASEVGTQYALVIAEIEQMLRRQLIAAIGRELGPADFAEYMDFHYRRLFRDAYRPRGFCYAIRRPGRFPEGTVSIESAAPSGAAAQPARTFVVHHSATDPMRFRLSAAAELSFYGDRYLHACVLHQFSGEASLPLRLAARARQFSSFILLVGKIAAHDVFDPAAALIVRDRDDLTLPLTLETIPTPKEFRDAIESLSPEQQRFAKAFRSMQLASTVFGVVVIQIKPQLERVLNLPDGALTKEVALTQQLMELFIKYQLPSDLLSFDGEPSAAPAAKLAAVKEHTAALRGMIDAARERELKEQGEVEKKRLMERPVVPTVYDDESSCYSVASRGAELESFMDGCVEEMAAAVPQRRSRGASFRRAGGAMLKGVKKMAPGLPKRRARQSSAGGAAAEAPLTDAIADAGAEAGEGATEGGDAADDLPRTATDGQQYELPSEGSAAGGGTVDYTELPGMLDRQFDRLDTDSAVRPTIIRVGDAWSRRSQAGLISDVRDEVLGEGEQREERDRAFDLLDALSRSGALPVDAAELHVVLAATHCFDESLLDTVVRRNVNPIEKAERSALIMSAAVQRRPARELVDEQHLDRVGAHSPALLRDG